MSFIKKMCLNVSLVFTLTFEYVVIFFSAEGIVIRISGPAGIRQSRGSGTESRTFTGKFNIALSYVAHEAFYFEWQLCITGQAGTTGSDSANREREEHRVHSGQYWLCLYSCVLIVSAAVAFSLFHLPLCVSCILCLCHW